MTVFWIILAFCLFVFLTTVGYRFAQRQLANDFTLRYAVERLSDLVNGSFMRVSRAPNRSEVSALLNELQHLMTVKDLAFDQGSVLMGLASPKDVVQKALIVMKEQLHAKNAFVFIIKNGMIERHEVPVNGQSRDTIPFQQDQGILGTALAANKVRVFPRSSDMLTPKEAALFVGSQELLCMPIPQNSDFEGLLALTGKVSGLPYKMNDVTFAAGMARMIELSFHNTDYCRQAAEHERRQHERKTADLVNYAFLPGEDPAIPTIELASHRQVSIPMGGDWHEYFLDQENQRLLLLMGDISSQGSPPALMTAAAHGVFKAIQTLKEPFARIQEAAQQLGSGSHPVHRTMQAYFRQLFFDPMTPSNLLNILNETISNMTNAHLSMGCVAIAVDYNRGLLSYANAGHEPPMYFKNHPVRQTQSRFQFLERTGPRLGEKKEASYGQVMFSLQPEDLIVLHTDGLTEATNPEGESFGSHRLTRYLERTDGSSAHQIKEYLVHEIKKHCGSTPITDDITFIVMRVKGKLSKERGHDGPI